jgi:uncharacterized phage-associated protein
MCKVSVFDVAKYILEKQSPMSTIKLQKLVYYSQAWSMVWDGVPIFDEDFQAWLTDPFVRNFMNSTKGHLLSII